MKYSCCTLSKKQIDDLKNPEIPDEQVTKLLKALSHPLRLRIVRLLLVEKEICTCELTTIFREQQPIVTKQLIHLKKQNLIEGKKITFSQKGEKKAKKTGRWTAYRLKDDRKELLYYLITPFMNPHLDKISYEE